MLANEPEAIYGGCEGPDSMYIKLISSDGHEFIIKREFALASTSIRIMLSGPCHYAENEVNLKDMSSHVLQRVCEYLAYKARYSDSIERAPDIPEFPLSTESAMDVLMAGLYLDI